MMPAHAENYPELLLLAVHELRSPAGIVSGYLQMLQRNVAGPLSEGQRRMIDEAERSCARLIALVAELSDLGQLDAGRLPLARKPFDLFALVGEAATSAREAADREARVDVRGEPAGAPLVGDEARMRTALAALVRAFLREQPPPAAIVADRRLVSNGGEHAAIIVIGDSASVESAQDAPRGRFDEKRSGVGLALPMAVRVIEAHGGCIWSSTGQSGHGGAVVSFPVSR